MTLKGVGKKTAEALEAADLFTFEQVVERYPVRYDEQFLDDIDGIKARYGYVLAEVISHPKIAYVKRNMQIISFRVKVNDATFLVKLYNQRFLMKMLMQKPKVVIYGKRKNSEIQAQRVLLADNFKEGIYPVYRIDGVTDKAFLKIVKQAFESLPAFVEIYPEKFVKEYDLLPRNVYIRALHEPHDLSVLKATLKRFRYEAVLRYLIKVAWRKRQHIAQKKVVKAYKKAVLRSFIYDLPFTLTTDQERAMNDILNDFSRDTVMSRMLQGDTGSGKTIVALFAMLATMSAHQQVAFLAPTEILAQQHFETCEKYLSGRGYTIALLTGSMSVQDKKRIHEGLKSKEIDGIVGTHSLFSDAVKYDDLGLVITDEQHRFGVNQRQQLSAKGEAVDVLYLSATPIPRTLAMTLYGDMSISTLKSKPGVRLKVKTKIITAKDKEIIRNAMRSTLTKNEQIYVVAPTIDTNESMHLFGVTTLYDVIKKRYKDCRVGLLHAQLDSQEKQAVLLAFKQGKIDILVSTTVIEVGIDIPNATLMIIYHAQRFGYAQLHQLRGRVGRSDQPAQCLMVTEGKAEESSRLAVLETVYDGFELSELDLQLRGFGDLGGTLQSGKIDINTFFEMADVALLQALKNVAEEVVSEYEKRGAYQKLMKIVKREMEISAFTFLKANE